MKRLISAITAITFILSICTTAVFASGKGNDRSFLPPGLAKKAYGLPYGIAKKGFDDIAKFPWAEQAIEKMRLKGLIKGKEEGKFAPESNVTKLETVIMALRIMGWEDETINLTKLPEKYKGKYINEWAKGYVSLAFEKDILDDVDMLYFNPEEPATRHEVAKYVIRALGYEDEAQDHMKDDLSFKDAAAIPQGSVGYVYIVNKMGLMIGDNNKIFNPMGTLTRAEMAVLFNRLDDKVDNDNDEDEYKGQIKSINNNEITLKINGESKSFDIGSGVKVYKNDKRISYSSLAVGDYVLLQFEDSKAVYIEVVNKDENDDKIITKYTGTVYDISAGKLTVKIDKMQIIFEAASNVEVYFNKEKGKFDEITDGDSVTVIVDSRNRAREIRVERERKEQDTEEIEGTVTSIDLTGTYHLSVDNTSYVLSEDAKVVIPNKTGSNLADLKVGYTVVCILEDNKIIKINVENQTFSESGKITAITESESGYKLELLINNKTKTYYVADDAVIIIPDMTNEDIEDLKVNQQGEFWIENNEIIKIVIK